jgi:DNA-binding HxlR family transcriptional regulator
MKVCPIDRSLKIIDQRYALHRMRNIILLKQNRFNQFLNSIEGINTKTLSIRLQQLDNFDHNSRTPYVSYINRSSTDHTTGVVLLLVYTPPKFELENTDWVFV